MCEVNIRCTVSRYTPAMKPTKLFDIESSFNQFDNTNSNKIVFALPEVKRCGTRLFFSSFIPDRGNATPIPKRIRTSLSTFRVHRSILPPSATIKGWLGCSAACLPLEGTLLGINRYPNVETKAHDLLLICLISACILSVKPVLVNRRCSKHDCPRHPSR